MPGLCAVLGEALGSDVSDIGVHTDANADALARGLGADAVTSGSDIFFRNGAFRPGLTDGLALLLHEAVHVLQQRTGHAGGVPVGGLLAVSDPADQWEAQARAVVTAVLAGCRAAGTAAGLPAAQPRFSAGGGQPQAGGWLVLQRFQSFEHKLLGDAGTTELGSVALQAPDRRAVLQAQQAFLRLWADDPHGVTEQDVRARFPFVRMLRLNASGLLVTYGELNSLPDYLPGGLIDDLPEQTLLPILQYVREQTFDRLSALLGAPAHALLGMGHATRFSGAVAHYHGHGELVLLLYASEIDRLTAGLGPLGSNQYRAMLARNACHFAPFSWHRWQSWHTVARHLAGTAAVTPVGSAERAELERQAWLANGHADHFLQDSFASGHLINKTLIMQFFIDWAKDNGHHLADWDDLIQMSASLQPTLAGRSLYPPLGAPLSSTDPQTVEELPSQAERIDALGLQPVDGSLTAAYGCYLSFLGSLALQLSANHLHDHFNATSLLVTSEHRQEPFRVWGDDTMLDRDDGVVVASEATQLSQRAIAELLDTGTSSVEPAQILQRLPTRVAGVPGGPLGIEEWNDSLRDYCAQSVFPEVRLRLAALVEPRMGRVSQDGPPLTLLP